LERRVINLLNEQGQWLEHLYLLRLEPAFYQVGLAYEAQSPRDLKSWQAETGALIVLNGGYFREEAGKLIPTGLIVVEGQAQGQSYDSFAGMLAVTAEGPELRWLEQTPYNPQEPLLAGLQSFPLLVKPGGELGFPAEYEDHQRARRTVIGQDRAGRLLFLVADRGYFSLHQLSLYLTDSDLALDIALNLDGGPSSGLLLAEPAEGVPAFSVLPLVITVQPRPGF
jgi:exopolysaccharide biosynthesis protein